MERRGLNIRKGFLKAVLPVIRSPTASGGVAALFRASAGWNTA